MIKVSVLVSVLVITGTAATIDAALRSLGA